MTRSAAVGLDTDVLVHWFVTRSPRHGPVRRWISDLSSVTKFALTQQVLGEFLHIVTDGRRFERPLPMSEALRVSRELWNSPNVEPVLAGAGVHDRVCELMEQFDLGRKRILDTQLAATLEEAGVATLATFNARDFECFPFLRIIDPTLDETS